MRIKYYISQNHLPTLEKPKHEKEISHYGKNYSYKGYQKESLSKGEKWGRAVVLMLELLKITGTGGGLACSKNRRRMFAQNFKELKTGVQKVKYFCDTENMKLDSVNKGLKAQLTRHSNDMIASGNEIKSAKIYMKVSNGKWNYLKESIVKPNEQSDLAAALASEVENFKSDLAKTNMGTFNTVTYMAVLVTKNQTGLYHSKTHTYSEIDGNWTSSAEKWEMVLTPIDSLMDTVAKEKKKLGFSSPEPIKDGKFQYEGNYINQVGGKSALNFVYNVASNNWTVAI